MKRTHNEQQMMREFAEFIDADPVAPDRHLDVAILNSVRNNLRPAPWKVYGKVTVIEATSGLVTLAICPQFGLGFSPHNEILHALHATTSSIVFYLLCGLLFVSFGAVLSGLILNRSEIRTVGTHKYLYFAVYSILAYLTLVVLGAEVFVISSLTWLFGAWLGNILGFTVAIRLRKMLIRPPSTT